MKFGQFISYYERLKYQISLQILQCENSFQVLLCFQRIKCNLYWKIKFLRQATYIIYVVAKLIKFVQVSLQNSSDSLLERSL